MGREAWCRGILLTLGPEPGARLPPPRPPAQPLLCFLHFPSTRLSCSFSTPFSLLPTALPLSPLPLHSFIFRCCFYSAAILSLLLSSAFQGLILASRAPWPLVALALPPKGSEPMSCSPGLNPSLLGPHGLPLLPLYLGTHPPCLFPGQT